MPPTFATDTRPVELRLTADTEARLREKAKAAGLSLEVYLEELAERDADHTSGDDLLAAAVRRLTSRTPEQVLAAREQLLKTARRGRPLPAGKALIEVVEGTWPGDETDEQIRADLEKLS